MAARDSRGRFVKGPGSGGVRDRDNGLEDLIRRAGKKLTVKVGIFGDNAARAALDGNGATVGQIMNAHEFGLGPPERSWLRRTVDQNQDKIERAQRKAAEATMKGMDPERALDLLGHGLVGLVKGTIIAGIPPTLSPEYLKKKLAKFPGASTPLIASAQSIGSISHEVETKK